MLRDKHEGATRFRPALNVCVQFPLHVSNCKYHIKNKKKSRYTEPPLQLRAFKFFNELVCIKCCIHKYVPMCVYSYKSICLFILQDVQGNLKIDSRQCRHYHHCLSSLKVVFALTINITLAKFCLNYMVFIVQ